MVTVVSESNVELSWSIGRKIRHLRWQRGETQLDLADRLGITYQEIQLYESGVRVVPLTLLTSIAAAQETPLEFYTET